MARMINLKVGCLGSIIDEDGMKHAESFNPQLDHMIAAAPDMYRALQDTVLQLQYLADKFGETGTGAQVLARVNAAIAKAEGR